MRRPFERATALEGTGCGKKQAWCLGLISQLINLDWSHTVRLAGWHIFSQLECNDIY